MECVSFLQQLNYLAFTPGKSRNLSKAKTRFLSFLSLSDKPPHFTPAQPPDGKSSVFPLRLPALTTEVLRGVPANNDLGQQIPASEVSCCLRTVPELAAYLFVSMLLVWQARGQVC